MSDIDLFRQERIQGDQLAMMFASNGDFQRAIEMISMQIAVTEKVHDDVPDEYKILFGDLLATFYGRRALWLFGVYQATKDPEIKRQALNDVVKATSFPRDYFPNSDFLNDLLRLRAEMSR